uniref:CRAL-TRIO domain-containing protein n=1 Tax=Panagrolaimus sp. JU765 TaxID=591449 RepID=A0AC34RJE2_9BILA
MVDPPNLTEEERHGVKLIREAFGDRIPENLNTDFNLRRWWIGHDKNISTIEEKMSLYLKNRKILGFQDPDFVANFYEREDMKKIMQYFHMSRITEEHINKDNALVFVEGGEFDKAVLHTATTGQYLKVFFACCELVLQTILKVEKKTGKPCHGLCIFDMGKVALTNHINPNSNCNKVFKARALIWENFYPGMIKHIVIANPPMILSVVWTVARFLLAEKQRELLKFCRNQEALKEIVGTDMLPQAFGGKLTDTKYTQRTDCCNERKPITTDDYFVEGSILKQVGVDSLPPAIQLAIKANSKCRVLCIPTKNDFGSFVAWKFTTSDQIQFCVHQGETLVYPSLKIITTEVPEEDFLKTEDENNSYIFEFMNSNRFMTVHVDIHLVASKVTNITELSLAA